VLREWITKRVTEILKIEDDVVIEYAISQIDDAEKPVRIARLSQCPTLTADARPTGDPDQSRGLHGLVRRRQLHF